MGLVKKRTGKKQFNKSCSLPKKDKKDKKERKGVSADEKKKIKKNHSETLQLTQHSLLINIITTAQSPTTQPNGLNAFDSFYFHLTISITFII